MTERIVGVLLVLFSNTLVVRAHVQLGDAWAIGARPTYLVTHGFYSKIRHPIYVFHMFTTLGIAMILQYKWFWLALPLEALIQIIRASRETRALRIAFGDIYMQYRNQTWF